MTTCLGLQQGFDIIGRQNDLDHNQMPDGKIENETYIWTKQENDHHKLKLRILIYSIQTTGNVDWSCI